MADDCIDKTQFHIPGPIKGVIAAAQAVSSAATTVTTAATTVADSAKSVEDTVTKTSSVMTTTTDDGAGNSTQLMEISQDNVPKDEWQNRQTMAYIALFAMIIATGALYFIPDVKRIEQLAIALTWFYGAMGGIVGAFMGFKAWQSSRGK